MTKITKDICIAFVKNTQISRFACRALFSLIIPALAWQVTEKKTVLFGCLAALFVILGLCGFGLWRKLQNMDPESFFIVRRKLENVSSRLSLHNRSIGLRYVFHFEKGWEYSVREVWGIFRNHWPDKAGRVTQAQADEAMIESRKPGRDFYLLVLNDRVIACFPQGRYELETGEYYQSDGRYYCR